MFRVTTQTILLLFTFFCYSQIEPIYSDYIHYTTEVGLPQSFITGLAQDKEGYLWISTRDGVARFDGKAFLRYAPDEDDANRQVSTNQINEIFLDQENNLWIYNFNNIIDKIVLNTGVLEKDVQPILRIPSSQFNLKVDSIRSPAEFFKDDNGVWYAGGYKEYRLFDDSNSKLTSLFKNPINDTSLISGFTSDQNGSLWTVIGTELTKSDSTWLTRTARQIDKISKGDNEKREDIVRMRLLDDNKLFIQIPKKEKGEVHLIIYDIDRDEFRKIDLPYETRFKRLIETFTYASNGDLIFDYHGKILRLSSDEKITLLWDYPFKPALEISALLMDKSENLWIGTNTGGLFSVDMNKPAFKAYEYDQNFFHDLIKYHMVDHSFDPANWLGRNWAYGLRYEYDKNKNLYVTNEFQFSRNRKIYRNGKLIEAIESYPDGGRLLYGISLDDNHIWSISVKGAIIQYDLTGRPILEKNFTEVIDGYNQPIDIVADAECQWVISVNNKLIQMKDGDVKQIFNPASDENSLVFLSKDINKDSILWIGTIGAGLLQWNKNTQNTTLSLTEKDGLPNNNIAGMVQDSLDNIWVSTFNGIAKIDALTGLVTTFNKNDGLHGSEFNRHHAFEFRDGRIAFGGPTGYTIFNPYALGETNFQPKISISQLSVNNQHFKKNLTDLTELRLPHDENSVVVDAAAMQFNDPTSNKFRYQLVGFNDDWVNNESNSRMRFDNLAPGKYNLLLNASNTNGLWSNHIRELAIIISPPFWKTWWAYVIYFITTLFLVYMYWKRYQKRIFEKQQLLFKEKEAKRFQEIDSIKTRFFSNITHEFRTPLTLILSPLEKELREKEHSEEVTRILESNYRQGSKLLDLVNQLLDISKLESGQMQTHKSVGDLEMFFRTIVNQFSDYSSEKGINLQFINDNIEGQYLLEKSHLEKIIVNLLSNAIKFTPKDGLVSVFLRESDTKQIVVKISDTGVGIAKDQLDKLFDRFYQVDSSDSRAQEGTGIGLSLVKELTELIGGKIDVASKLSEGTEFTLTLPLEKVISSNSKIEHETTTVHPSDNAPVFLVVEDNDELRKFIIDSLNEKGKVLSASNGQEGWKIIEKELPDIVISDVMMPIMNGYDLCEKVKTDLRTSHISFILLTAKTAQESKELGLGAGADDYLTKPFRVKELELRISNILTQKESIKQHYRDKLLTKDYVEPATKPKDEFLEKLYGFLDANLSNSNLKLDGLAKELGMSKSTLNRKMRSLLDISTSDFIQRYRIQKSTLYLSEGGPISEVAYKVGFESPSYFTQCFKEIHNQTPSEFQHLAGV